MNNFNTFGVDSLKLTPTKMFKKKCYFSSLSVLFELLAARWKLNDDEDDEAGNLCLTFAHKEIFFLKFF